MPFSFLKGENLPELAKQFKLGQYIPEIAIEGLATGVDNIRIDVYLSPKFLESTRQHITKLIAKYGNIEDFLKEDPFAMAASAGPSRTGGFISSPKPPSIVTQTGKMPAVVDFKTIFSDLHVAALNRAKTENNINWDLLARLAIIKFIRTEMQAQFSQLLERCRMRLKAYEGPRTPNPQKGVEMRERFSKFQVGKKNVLRKAGQDLFSTLREVEKETTAKLRRSMFGDQAAGAYDLFVNRLLFSEDGRDDLLNAEQYVMLGNYDRDQDRFQTILEFAYEFLKSLGYSTDEKALDAMLNVPENAQELFAGGTPNESTPPGKAQRSLLNSWVSFLESENVMEHVIASYEAVPILTQYCPPINPQQLKNALVSKTERKRVETLLEEQGRISPDGLNSAVRKVEGTKGADRAKIAGRYFSDFIRYHRDLRRFEAVSAAMDGVNVVTNEKLRELSAINNTLHEFLLTEEQKPSEASIVSHVILKADIRDSTTLTRTLYERGLNPASYFSLNFFDPVNKLLPKYSATKVFIEGDALILALFEREGDQSFGVGKTCMLAKEMIQIVRAYNEQAIKSGLPNLELGLGICFQDSAPMYLMDGTHRIMISKALNESDRLSGCSKGARRFVTRETQFSVFSFQTVDDSDTGGMPDEFLVRYNIGGIHINSVAFEKLRKEISLQEHVIELPLIWGPEKTKLYSGVVPVERGIFHKILVREGTIARVDGSSFAFEGWTDKKFYEVVVNDALYEQLASAFPLN
jgi:hypothetical protein